MIEQDIHSSDTIRFFGQAVPIDRLVWIVAAIVLPVKLLLAGVLPMTEDEAYFVLWGLTPSLGYSEHPPMIGWIEALVLAVGRHPLLVRLPAILGTLSIGIGLHYALRSLDRRRAALTATLFLLSPLDVVYVIVTTDTPLIVFSFWSAVLLYRATRDGGYRHYAASGALLGLAFLSKYFAVLLALAYVVAVLSWVRNRRAFAGLAVLLLCVVPFGLISLYWNYTHSWMEVRYPLYRDDDAQLSLIRPLTFLAMQLFLLLPAGLPWLFRRVRQLPSRVLRQPVGLFAVLFVVPISILCLLSLRKSIGLHWLLSFYPLLYPAVGWLLEPVELRRAARIAAAFSTALVLLLLAVAVAPLGWFEEHRQYKTFVVGLRPAELLQAMAPHAEGRRLAVRGYGMAALLDYHLPGQRVAAFGAGSHHGRNDDLVTDWREWNGADVLLFERRPPVLDRYTPYFDRVTVETIHVANAEFFLVLGDNFDYDAYRDGILAKIRDRYYDIPTWLPVDTCYYRARYFPDQP